MEKDAPMRRATSVAAPVAHLVGPGKLKVVNGHLAFATHDAPGPLRLDPRALRAVYCYGPVGVTDDALQVLFAHDVELAFLTPVGTRCRGRLVRSDPPRAEQQRVRAGRVEPVRVVHDAQHKLFLSRCSQHGQRRDWNAGGASG